MGKLKPFDKCLVRENIFCVWMPALYGMKNPDGKYLTSAGWQNMCVRYEGNEELLGTTDIPLSEYCKNCEKTNCHGLEKCQIVRDFREKVKNL